MTTIPTPATYEPYLDLYKLLFAYINKGGHSPPIADTIQKKFVLYQKNLFLTEEYVRDLFTHFHKSNSTATKQSSIEVLCEFAFQDLAGFLSEPEVEKLFNSFLKFCRRIDHLYILFLSVDPEFPNHVTAITNNTKRYEEHIRSPHLNKVHIFVEK